MSFEYIVYELIKKLKTVMLKLPDNNENVKTVRISL